MKWKIPIPTATRGRRQGAMHWQIAMVAALLLLVILAATAIAHDPSVTEIEQSAPTTATAADVERPTSQTQQLTLRNVAAEVGLTFVHGAFRESIAEDPAAMMGGGLCWLD